jgi:hypothetical protein
MAYTYSKIATYTVGSGGIGSVAFLNIPQNYTDLILKTSSRNSGGNVGNYSGFLINAVTTPTGRYIQGNGSTVSSNTTQYGQMETGGAATANSFSNTETYFPNYTSSNYKSISTDSVVENSATEGYNSLSAGLISTSSPITSIIITPATGTFVQHSTFHLYGIKAEV